MTVNRWNPDQYLKFQAEREKPFWDLIAPIRGRRFERILDVGCGTGNLTEKLAAEFHAPSVTGVDASPTMLAKARANSVSPVRYVESRFEDFPENEKFDLIFSNAAIQWMPNQPQVFAKLKRLLNPGGVLLVQMPNNYGEPSHRLAMEQIEGYAEVDATERHGVLPLNRYAEILFELGFQDIDLREKIYLHPMKNAAEIAEWTRGSFLTEFEKQMTESRFEEFVESYKQRLVTHYGPGPCLFLFHRLLLGCALP